MSRSSVRPLWLLALSLTLVVCACEAGIQTRPIGANGEPIGDGETSPGGPSTEGPSDSPGDVPWTLSALNASVTTGVAPLAVEFTWTLEGSGEGFSCNLDTGDGRSDRASVPCALGNNAASATYTAAGSFEAVLTVRDAAGSVRSNRRFINVGETAATIAVRKLEYGQSVFGEDLRLVSGKNVFVRITLESSRENERAPAARVLAIRNGQTIGTATLVGPSTVPTASSNLEHGRTYRTMLPGNWIENGLTLALELGGARVQTFTPTLGSGNTLDVLWVPLVVNGRRGDAPANDEARTLASLFPVNAMTFNERAAYTVEDAVDVTTQNGWLSLLYTVGGLRYIDGGTRHYYGLVDDAGVQNFSGYGYFSRPAAVGMEDVRAVRVMAHELTHNWGREHAPCNTNSGLDSSFPFSNGRIGAEGYDVIGEALVDASTPDVTGQCDEDGWLSRYSYDAIQRYLEEKPASSLPTQVADLTAPGRPMMFFRGQLSGSGAKQRAAVSPLHLVQPPRAAVADTNHTRPSVMSDDTSEGVPPRNGASTNARTNASVGVGVGAPVERGARDPVERTRPRSFVSSRVGEPAPSVVLHVVGTKGEYRAVLNAEVVAGVNAGASSVHAWIPVDVVGDVRRLELRDVTTGRRLHRSQSSASTARVHAVTAREENGVVSVSWKAPRTARALVAHLSEDGERTTLVMDARGGAIRLPLAGVPLGGQFEVSVSTGLHAERFVLERHSGPARSTNL